MAFPWPFRRRAAPAAPQPSPASPKKSATRAYRPYRPMPGDERGYVGLGLGGYQRNPSSFQNLAGYARDLGENNAFASIAVETIVDNVVGTGIRFSFTGDLSYDAHFYEWATSPDLCDHDGRLDFYGLQALAVRMMILTGNGFLIRRDVLGRIGLAPQYQAVDTALLATGASPTRADHRVFNGVEISASGRVHGYHFYDAAVDGSFREPRFFSADSVIHLMETKYPGQLLGIPRGTQALMEVDTLQAFVSAELQKQRAQSCIVAAITRNADYDGVGAINTDGTEADETGERSGEPYVPERVEPGLVMHLADGESMSAFIPSSSAAADGFARLSLQAISAAYRVTYFHASGDLSRVNFSSSKIGLGAFYLGADVTRAHHVLPQIRRVESQVREAYDVSSDTPSSPELDIRVITPAREMIEPLKEVSVEMLELQMGATSLTRLLAKRGLDFDVHVAELVRERARLKELGIETSWGDMKMSDVVKLLTTDSAPSELPTSSQDPQE